MNNPSNLTLRPDFAFDGSVDSQRVLDAISNSQSSILQPGDDALIDRVGLTLRRAMKQVAPERSRSQATAAAIVVTANVVTVNADEGKWRVILPGVERKTLHRLAADDVAIMLRMQPGAVLHAHAHARDESCVLISGRLRVGADLLIEAGGFHWVAQGTAHEPITAEVESLVYLRGALDAHA